MKFNGEFKEIVKFNRKNTFFIHLVIWLVTSLYVMLIAGGDLTLAINGFTTAIALHLVTGLFYLFKKTENKKNILEFLLAQMYVILSITTIYMFTIVPVYVISYI